MHKRINLNQQQQL